MNKNDLQTPAILLNLDAMEKNLRQAQALAEKNAKQIWPMIKTHKSTELALLQKEIGAKGFLCGTLDECEALLNAGVSNIMYAYPVSAEPNISRVIKLSRKANFFIRIDNMPAAFALNEGAKKAKITINYTVIVDCGLHRFGVGLDKLESFMEEILKCENLNFCGISTHPGQVYGCSSPDGVEAVTQAEIDTMAKAAEILKKIDQEAEIVSSGSTPTYYSAVQSSHINIFHPGNYIFMDNIQIALDCAKEEDCALTVLATVISNPADGLFIVDAGSKCLGLDQGAHGNGNITGFGIVKGHPELTIYSLSEEVGKIKAEGSTNLKVGEKIEIIPNHSCSAANTTNYYIGCRNNEVERLYKVDMRSNSTAKGFVIQ